MSIVVHEDCLDASLSREAAAGLLLARDSMGAEVELLLERCSLLVESADLRCGLVGLGTATELAIELVLELACKLVLALGGW